MYKQNICHIEIYFKNNERCSAAAFI